MWYTETFKVQCPHRGGVKNFTGLPIPVAALMLSSFYLTGFYSETAAAILMLAVSILMVSSVEYPKVSGKSALMVLLLIMVAIITGLMTGAISGPSFDHAFHCHDYLHYNTHNINET